MSYAGESDGKKIARALMLIDISSKWEAMLHPGGKAIVVAGHGHDVAPLRDALKWPTADVIACDTDPVAVDRWKALWPGTVAVVGRVEEVIAQQSDASIGLALVDLCGHVEQVTKSAKALGNKLRRRGVSTFTIERAREGNQKKLNMVKELMSIASVDDEIGDLSDARELWNCNRLREALDAGATRYTGRLFDLCFGRIHYRNEIARSPMSIVMFTRCQRPKMDMRTPMTPRAFKVKSDARVREYALDLNRPSSFLDAIFSLPPGTVAAWKAHQTRGSYALK